MKRVTNVWVRWCLLSSLLTIGIHVSAQVIRAQNAESRQDPIIGTWEGFSGDNKFREKVYISRKNDGAWHVFGEWFDKGSGVKKGAFKASQYQYRNGHLFFHQTYSPKPDPGWSADNDLEVWVAANKLQIRHRYGTSSLSKAQSGRGIDPLIGTWEGFSGDNKFREKVYISKKSNGTWHVWGEWLDKQTGTKRGAFTASRYRYENGHLFVYQTYAPKPDPGWAKDNDLEFWVVGNRIYCKHRYGTTTLNRAG